METILALNCGSSSVKYAVFDAKLERLDHGIIESLSVDAPARLRRAGNKDKSLTKNMGHEAAISHVLNIITKDHATPTAVGHRVVHGGDRFTAPQRITDEVLANITTLVPLAPAHQPHNIAGIKSIREIFPSLPQVACFDTAFHATIPDHRKILPVPQRFVSQGLRRYGFHGLSYEHLVGELPRHLGQQANGKIVLCHLGNGCSLAGINNFECQTTTMGFTPLDGLMMGQRPGRLDPGAVLWLVEQMGGNIEKTRELLNKNSGLLGVSGTSADMRLLLGSRQPEAKLAVRMFVDRLAQEIAAAAAAIGGLDAIIFSGGIGENAVPIRWQTMETLAFLGLQGDPHANGQNAARITTPGSKISAHVIATNEELTIARATSQMLHK